MARRIALLLALVLALLIAAVPVAAKNNKNGNAIPTRIELPAGLQPEGITAGRGNTFYVGSLANGAIYRGNLRTGVVDMPALVPGVAGLTAVGIDYERRNDRIWVAGGNTQQVRVYNASTGALLATYPFVGAGFLNDLVATRNAVYVTDSNNAVLRVIPLGVDGALPPPAAAFSRTLSGSLAPQLPPLPPVPDGFNLNGIDAAGRWLIAVQSNTGFLHRIDPATGAATQIALSSAPLLRGDGIEVRGRTIFVVRNRDNLVAVLKANGSFTSAELKRELTAAAGVLDVPTTAIVKGNRVWVVNARFPPPALTQPATYWITQLKNK